MRRGTLVKLCAKDASVGWAVAARLACMTRATGGGLGVVNLPPGGSPLNPPREPSRLPGMAPMAPRAAGALAGALDTGARTGAFAGFFPASCTRMPTLRDASERRTRRVVGLWRSEDGA